MKFTKAARVFAPSIIFSAFALVPCPVAAQVSSAAESAAIEYPMVGAGVRTRPAYDGSDSRITEPVPVLRYYGRPLFVRSTRGVLEAGARVNLTPELILGAQAAYEQGRNSDD